MEEREEDHVYGTVPRSNRRLFILVLGIAGVLVVGGGLLVNALTRSPIQWGLLLSVVGLLMVVLAIYLWIRLSD